MTELEPLGCTTDAGAEPIAIIPEVRLREHVEAIRELVKHTVKNVVEIAGGSALLKT